MVERRNYCQWGGHSGRNFFLPMRHGFIYPVTSTAKTAAFSQRLIRERSKIHHLVIRILVSENRPIILRWHYQLWRLLWSDSLPLHWTFKWERNFHGCLQQDGATAYTARFSVMLLRDVFGDRIISRDIWPPRSPVITLPFYYLWGATEDVVYKDNPYTLSLNWTKSSEISSGTSPPIEFSRVSAKKIRCRL
jgi:hypothetical protein